ncbi:MAG: HAMP domain-containing sensor histidine kinase [Candidatus Omnitrophica bacterium]|nr:HAMP domain-containing sensor histidine kinase [Candidatus Omnitrophota bacterium]
MRLRNKGTGESCELEEVDRLKKEFLSIASHELRTPLATVKNAINLIADEASGPLNETQRKFLMMANRNVDKLALIINDFFLLADLESGCVELSRNEVDINEDIENAINIFSDLAKVNQVAISFEPDRTVKTIIADRQKILNVLTNLISNAIKFSHNGGAVTVSTTRHNSDKGFVQVKIKDTGIGIDKKDHDKLFRSFQQIDSSLTRKFAGSGLGLAICKRIIELHKGKIWVESEAGRGSVFVFILPVK